jgi:HK97 family phage prohead protease
MSESNQKVLACEIKALGDRQVETTASTGSLDRELDRILASAWDLDAYRRNAVVLWGHDHRLPPIAKSIDIRVVGNALRTIDQFPPRGVYALADQVHDLVKAGFITSKSVGFRPRAWRPNDAGGRDYTDVELLEHSYVSIPANPEAVVTAKAKGVRDPAALTRWFGTPRGGEAIEVVDDSDERVFVDERTLAEARAAVLGRQVRAEVRRQARGLFGVAPPDDAVLVLDDGQPGADDAFVVDERDIQAAMAHVIATTVGRELRQQLNALRGRVD